MATVSNANGTVSGVTSTRRHMTESIIRAREEAAILRGDAYVLSDTTVTPTGAADVFCKIYNGRSDNMIITRIVAQVDTATDNIFVQSCAAYTSATSHAELAPINRLRGSSKLATTGDSTFESDVNITGDSGAVTLYCMRLAAADTMYVLETPIILGTGQCLLLEAETGGNDIQYSVDFFYDTEPYTDD